MKSREHVRRIAILVFSSALLYGAFSQWSFLTSYSERFHATVPLIWLIHLVLNRKPDTKPSLGYTGATFIGVLGGATLFFYQVAAMQARMAGGSTDWVEPLYKVSLLASCFAIYSLWSSITTWAYLRLPKIRDALKTPRGRWLPAIRIVLTFAVFAPYLFTTFNVHRFKVHNSTNPQAALQLPFEAVNFPSEVDNLNLSGWFIPAPNSDTTIIVGHGIGANKSNMLSLVPFLHGAGFNVFLFDLRGHGDSAGHTISFGVCEARDVRGAVRYLSQTRGIEKIGVYSFSMGGSAVLHAIKDLPEVDSVLVDSTFADFPTIVSGQVSFLPTFLNSPMVAVTDFYSRLELGASLNQMSSRQHIAEVSPRPLFIIHGTADILIPPSQAEINFATALEPKQLWLIEGADHCQGHQIAGKEYEKRVVSFFKSSIK